jgi:hypothetical protein
MEHLKGNCGTGCYFVEQTKVEDGPLLLSNSDMEVLDCLLLAIDNFVSGNLHSTRAADYVGRRLIELGKAMHEEEAAR